MPTYNVTGPDGRKYRVTAPDGASQEEIIAYAQKNVPPVDAAQVGAEQATADTSPLQTPFIMAGRTMDRLAAGAKQAVRGGLNRISGGEQNLSSLITGKQGPGLGDRAVSAIDRFGAALGMDPGAQLDDRAEQDRNTKAVEPLAKRDPVLAFAGEAAPALAAKTPLGFAGMAALEYGTPEEKAMRTGLAYAGGKAGEYVLGKVLPKAIQPNRGAPDAAVADAVGAAERIGYKPTAGQQTGSKGIQAIEQQLSKNAVAGGQARAFNEANQQAVNSAAARAMGENATKLTDDVLAGAQKRIGGTFEDVSSRNTVNVAGDDILSALAKLDEQQRALGSFAQPQVSALVDKGLDLAAKGNVEGKTYQIIRSELGKQAKSAYAGQNSTLGDALKSVQRALDDAADASISAADKEMWSLARKQWQALKLVNTKNGIVEGGNVSAAKLATKVDKAGTVRSQELRDIAKIGETFKPLPDSGTASNLLTQLLMTGGAGMVGAGALATSLLAPAAASKAVFSDVGRKYLTQGLTDVSPAVRKRLERAGGLLGLPGLGYDQ
jgi:hypothetical protein